MFSTPNLTTFYTTYAEWSKRGEVMWLERNGRYYILKIKMARYAL